VNVNAILAPSRESQYNASQSPEDGIRASSRNIVHIKLPQNINDVKHIRDVNIRDILLLVSVKIWQSSHMTSALAYSKLRSEIA